MNLPAVLDVALGLVVLYLLLSTICSFSVELLSSWLWWRKILLYKTLARLLTGESDCRPPKSFLLPRLSGEHPDDVLTAFWDHPLAVALAPDKRLPSYIEPSTFAAIAIDLAVPGAATGALPTTSEGLERLIRQAANSADAAPPSEQKPQPADKPQPAEKSSAGGVKMPCTRQVRHLRQSILTAFRASGLNRPPVPSTAPVVDLRKSLEKWYNEAMDRSTGEYKRKAQCWLLALGVILATAFNADTIRTVYVLSTNDSLRSATATYAATLVTDTNAIAAANQMDVVDLRTNLVAELKQLQKLQQLGFPLGWKNDFALNFTPYDGLGGWAIWKYLIKIAGLLATALAVSLGAPFWFDLLNKLVSMRASGSRIPTSEPSPKTKSTAEEMPSTPPPAAPVAGEPVAVAPLPAGDFAKDLADARVEFNARRAYWLAEAALLAYSAEAPVRVAVQQWGLELAHFFDKVEACQGFLAVSKDKKIALLAFRGTEQNLADWKTDSEFKLIPSPAGAGQTHEGFTNQLNQVYAELAAKLKQHFQEQADTLLYVTGHSLGAALATLMAACLAANKTCGVHSVHTFGSPRVGDREFAKNYELALGHCTYRVVNAEDLVTLVPPINLGKESHYDHVGQVVFFDSDGHLKLSAGFWERLLNTVTNALQDFQNAVKASLKDHSMEGYVRLLKQQSTRE